MQVWHLGILFFVLKNLALIFVENERKYKNLHLSLLYVSGFHSPYRKSLFCRLKVVAGACGLSSRHFESFRYQDRATEWGRFGQAGESTGSGLGPDSYYVHLIVVLCLARGRSKVGQRLLSGRWSKAGVNALISGIKGKRFLKEYSGWRYVKE